MRLSVRVYTASFWFFIVFIGAVLHDCYRVRHCGTATKTPEAGQKDQQRREEGRTEAREPSHPT